MRDVIKVFAAGAVLTAYAVLTPGMVEAVPSAASPRKAFAQRLPQAEGDYPVSLSITRTQASGVDAVAERLAPMSRLPNAGALR